MLRPMNQVLQHLLAFLLLGTPWQGQGTSIPVLKLGIKDEVPVLTQYATPILFPARCDREQNVYLRFYAYPNTLEAPWLKISADGKITATYSLASVTEYKNLQGLDFAIGPRGEFVVLAAGPNPKNEKESKVVVVTFDPDGSYRAKAELGIESTISPAKILPLPDGNFFVTGRLLEDNGGSQTDVTQTASVQTSKPFNAIVGPAGRIIKSFSIQNDVVSKPSSKQSEPSGTSLPEIALGEAVLGDDFNIYLMRRTQNPSVFVISASGELIRSFEIKRPSETATSIDMKWGAGGKLAFLFRVPSTQTGASPSLILSVVDSQTGETQINYQPGTETGAAVACFTPNGITFVGATDDGHLALKHVAPR
jgi:hypothetical protein